MNSDIQAHHFAPDERDVVAALAKICALSTESLEVIREKMNGSDISFVDACLQLSLATVEQIADAIAMAHSSASQGTSLIQVAIKRASKSRGLIATEAQAVATPSKKLGVAYDPYSIHGEKVRALRTELLLRNDPKNQGVILAIVGANPNEGRSQLVAELAIAFAQANKRTLLIDCNMRQPQQHVLFDCNNSSGLSDAISHVGSKPYYYSVAALPHLFLLTSGSTQSNPLELLSQSSFSTLMSGWERSFEYVLLDTPPVSLYSDALAIAAIAGNVVLVSRAKHSSLSDCKGMMRRLAATQSIVVGAVINRF
ncbi:MAG: CpsD/CapB family tyrosine-protein kinase [Steroidobacteraceae bacterium]